MHIDIAIASIPYTGYSSPPPAPAYLKGHLKKYGFNAKTFELGIKFKNFFNDPTDLGTMIRYWTGVSPLAKELAVRYQEYLEKTAKSMVDSQADWLALSIFTRDSVIFATDFLPWLKRLKGTDQKILLGGHGLNVLVLDQLESLIDCYILGDGELALLELLKGNTSYPGIKSPGVQIENLDELGWPDYSDYDLHAGYDNWYDNITLIPITGSRGCVRDCSFCDVRDIWSRYKYRSGANIAQEMIYQYEKTGHRHFFFTDSLINGNVKELMNMMRCIADYRKTNKVDITWGGQWIARKQKGLPKDYYKLIAASGGRNLTIGVETGSDKVRADMRKGFTNEDLDAEMDQFSQHGITCGFYILVGYPTESEKDFHDTLRMLKRYVKYVADGTLVGVAAGTGYQPQKNQEQDQVQLYDSSNIIRWKSPHSNHLENIRRKLIIHQVLNNLCYPGNELSRELLPVLRNSSMIFDESDRNLIDELLPNKSLVIPQEFEPNVVPEPVDFDLTLESISGETKAHVSVFVNSVELFSGEIDGLIQLNFKILDLQKRNMIKITLNNKGSQSEIELNKKILVKEILLNGSRFRFDTIYFLGRVKTHTFKDKGNVIFDNGCFEMYFENPVHKFFIRKKSFFHELGHESNRVMLDKVFKLFEHFVR